ncbi:hypothetical protein B9Z07_29910 [Burkholderia cenocepacia]|uniref:Uncharacterized protein n=1 Tax=Burkholderia cenocepacia TaxID=95486 RepID=A0AAD0J7C6_9BURK|nr:hypothetical protein B9Z07_29910 [Burkholderia cenocepacia]RQU97988.1 hypothetical protein DF042_26400 [Burkholderia cenocepacia]
MSAIVVLNWRRNRTGALGRPRSRSVTRLVAVDGRRGGRLGRNTQAWRILPGRPIRPRKPGTSRGKPAQNAQKSSRANDRAYPIEARLTSRAPCRRPFRRCLPNGENRPAIARSTACRC